MQGFSVSDLYTLTLFYFFKWACIILFKVQNFLLHLEKKQKVVILLLVSRLNLKFIPSLSPAQTLPLALTVFQGVKIKGEKLYGPRYFTVSRQCNPQAQSSSAGLNKFRLGTEASPHHTSPCWSQRGESTVPAGTIVVSTLSSKGAHRNGFSVDHCRRQMSTQFLLVLRMLHLSSTVLSALGHYSQPQGHQLGHSF